MDGLTYGPLKQGGAWVVTGLKKDGTPSNAHGYFKSIKNLCDAIL